MWSHTRRRSFSNQPLTFFPIMSSVLRPITVLYQGIAGFLRFLPASLDLPPPRHCRRHPPARFSANRAAASGWKISS